MQPLRTGPFTRANNIPLQVLNAKRGGYKHGIYHLNNVNAYHSSLKRWLRLFNGVSTKYLPNYLVWFQRYDSMRTVPWNVVANRLLDHSPSVRQVHHHIKPSLI